MSEDVKEKETYKRPSWDEYFLNLVQAVRTRGTCDRGRSGCVIVNNNRILSTGYVGSPLGTAHCDDVGHEMHTVIHEDGSKTQHCIRTAHNEQNAIANAARFGVALDGATIYCHMTPCYTCAKMIINAGIKRVVCEKDYHGGERSREIFKEAGVKYELVTSVMETYDNM
jgi:dCMP deaminase